MMVVKLYTHRRVRMLARTRGETKCDDTNVCELSKPVDETPQES